MSRYAGVVRSLIGVTQALDEARRQWRQIRDHGLRQDGEGYTRAIEVRELALAQLGYLEAILALLRRGSGSRGSHLVTDPKGALPHDKLGDEWRYVPEKQELRKEILLLTYRQEADAFETRIAAPNARQEGEFWFENTWAEYRRASIFKRDAGDDPRPCRIYQS